MAIATIAGVLAATRLARREGTAAETVVDVAFWTVLAGIAGAKIWFVVQFWNEFEDKWDLVRNFRSGLVYYGGLVGGTVAVIAYCRLKRLSLLKMLDICSPPAALGLAFGRLGCFFNGCCYGVETNSWLGVCFRRVVENDTVIGSAAYVDQLSSHAISAADAVTRPLLPTQLFESGGAVLVFAALLLARRARRVYGEQTALLFVLYPIVRFTVEFFRGDHGPAFAGLTIPQIFSVAACAAGAAAFAYLRLAVPAGLAVRAENAGKEPARATKTRQAG